MTTSHATDDRVTDAAGLPPTETISSPAGPAAASAPVDSGTGWASRPATAPPVPPATRPSAPRRVRRLRRTVLATVGLLLVLVVGFVGGAAALALGGISRTTAGSAAPPIVATAPSTGSTVPSAGSTNPAGPPTVQTVVPERVAAALLPSVVSIVARTQAGVGEGSGVILSADGLILTNNHVVDGATDLELQFSDDTVAGATLVGGDRADDVAVIRAQGVSGLTPAPLGTAAGLQVGAPVITIGSPFGLSATVTSGIVSALNRPVVTSPDQSGTPDQGQKSITDPVINAIQTDAAINPGNSGGPLVDRTGTVVGIVSAIASLPAGTGAQTGSSGVGFAIPIDQADRIAQEIISTGQATQPVLGVTVANAVGVDGPLTIGATVTQVAPGSGAESAGLQVGDVLTRFADQSITSADGLIAAVRAAAPNSTVEIAYARGGASSTVAVTLGSVVVG